MFKNSSVNGIFRKEKAAVDRLRNRAASDAKVLAIDKQM